MKHGGTLLIHRKQLGDLLLLQPAIAELARQYGGPVLVRTRRAFCDLLTLMPGQVELVDNLRQVCDRVVCFDTRLSSVLVALMAWPARRILVHTRSQEVGWLAAIFHQVIHADARHDYRARVFFAAVGGRDFQPPHLKVPPAEWLPPGLPKKFLVVHPTSAWRRKTWPAENWIALLTRLMAQDSPQILVTAGTAAWEQQMADAIASALPGSATSLGGKTSLRAYLAVLAHAEAVLTVDGSASHLAAAFGRPVLTLFGPTNPQHWHFPQASSRRLWAGDFCSDRKPPVAAIPVDVVFQVALDLLADVNG